jgi:hypothetical protein
MRFTTRHLLILTFYVCLYGIALAHPNNVWTTTVSIATCFYLGTNLGKAVHAGKSRLASGIGFAIGAIYILVFRLSNFDVSLRSVFYWQSLTAEEHKNLVRIVDCGIALLLAYAAMMVAELYLNRKSCN